MNIFYREKNMSKVWHKRTVKGWKTKRRNNHMRALSVFWFRLKLSAVVVAGVYSTLLAVQAWQEVKAYSVEGLQYVQEVSADVFHPVPPIMKRIAKCESGDTHFGKSGQVLVMGNTNKTVDVGRYQINTVHFATATEMGLDLFNEKDNEAFALYLYETQGTEPWVYSKKCWK